MPTTKKGKFIRRILAIALAVFVLLLIVVYLMADSIVIPILKDRLHTLIIQGSDSLYTYRLGKLKANFFGGNVEVENLQVEVDSARYQYLSERNQLPSLTMQLSLGSGKISGICILALLLGKEINIDEIISTDADI